MPTNPLETAALDFANTIRQELGLDPLAALRPGHIHNTMHCPLGKTIGDAQICPNVVITHDPHREFPMPADVVTFVADFDRGEFPHLFLPDARNPHLR